LPQYGQHPPLKADACSVDYEISPLACLPGMSQPSSQAKTVNMTDTSVDGNCDVSVCLAASQARSTEGSHGVLMGMACRQQQQAEVWGCVAKGKKKESACQLQS